MKIFSIAMICAGLLMSGSVFFNYAPEGNGHVDVATFAAPEGNEHVDVS
jgi:hypothetical protein